MRKWHLKYNILLFKNDLFSWIINYALRLTYESIEIREPLFEISHLLLAQLFRCYWQQNNNE